MKKSNLLWIGLLQVEIFCGEAEKNGFSALAFEEPSHYKFPDFGRLNINSEPTLSVLITSIFSPWA